MNIIVNDASVELYIRHICIEIFQSDFYKDIDLTVNIIKDDDKYSASAHLLGHTSFSSQKISLPSAKTCAVGKAIILLGVKLGYSPSPYGVLTGVRPVKIASQLIKKFGKEECINLLKNEYFVKREKISSLIKCANVDKEYREEYNKNDVSLYLSIPFCPTRCNYCSFVSASTERQRALIPEYLKTLFCEMNEVERVVSENNLIVRSVYVGGGTPGILDESQTNSLISQINKLFVTDNCIEFNYEIGRPETVTREKLNVLKDGGVNRISINTQSTSNEVLKAIGRRHSSKQYFDAVVLSREIGFESINTDLIAGLEADTLNTFKKSVDEVICAGVNSITIHSLCLKKSSKIKDDASLSHFSKNIDEYIEYAKNNCISNGFEPYYLYRQKYSLGNHETVGYTKNKPSYYNIVMMNEIGSVIGMGAGATSRISLKNNNLHFANYKYPYEYIKDSDKFLKELYNMDTIFKTLTGENG